MAILMDENYPSPDAVFVRFVAKNANFVVFTANDKTCIPLKFNMLQ